MAKKNEIKLAGSINIPIDPKLESELRSHVLKRKESEPHICLSDVVRAFIRDGLNATAMAK